MENDEQVMNQGGPANHPASAEATRGGERHAVRVRLFAGAAEAAGKQEIVVQVCPGASLADLKVVLVAEHPRLAPWVACSRWAVGTDFIDENYTLDVPPSCLVLIPPVSGG